jgi:hypothetical protein
MEGGREQRVIAQSLDIAAGGMRVASPEPLPASSDVHFTMVHGDFEGSARVRYSSKANDGRYVIGLEFTPETSREMFAYTVESEKL